MVDRLCTSLGGLSLSAIRRYTALAAEREDCIVLTIGDSHTDQVITIIKPRALMPERRTLAKSFKRVFLTTPLAVAIKT